MGPIRESEYSLVNPKHLSKVVKMKDQDTPKKRPRPDSSGSTVVGGALAKKWGPLLGLLGALIVVGTAVFAGVGWGFARFEDYVSKRIANEQAKDDEEARWIATEGKAKAALALAEQNASNIKEIDKVMQAMQAERKETDRLLLKRTEDLFNHYHPKVHSDPPDRDRKLNKMLNKATIQAAFVEANTVTTSQGSVLSGPSLDEAEGRK